MKLLASELPIAIDVDETLVGKMYFTRPPHDQKYLRLDYYGTPVYVRPNLHHIAFLKACKARGYDITVWSGNGYQWAKAVIVRLNLEPYVAYVASKPILYVDDKDAPEWMRRVYIESYE